MRSINTIFLHGTLGREPELRVAKSGREVASLNLATRRSTRDGDGWTEVTDWHRVVVFDWQARHASDRLAKGDTVSVVGQLRSSQWTDAEGKSQKRWEIVAETLGFARKPPVEVLASEPLALADKGAPEELGEPATAA